MLPPKFRPMRSVAPDKLSDVQWPKYASVKIDGIRACKPIDETVSKSGKPLPNKFFMAWMAQNAPSGIDCEVVVGDPANGDETYRNTFSGIMSIEGQPDFNIYIFDLCHKTGPESGYCNDRLSTLELMFGHTLWKDHAYFTEVAPRTFLVKQFLLNSQEELDAFYAQALEDGYEGVILRDPAGFYKYGKCTAREQYQFKIKPEHDAEAEILYAYEAEENLNTAFTNEVGETKRSSHQENKVGKGMLGGYHVRDLATGMVFDCGAGKLTHAERVARWLTKDTAPGKFIKYRSMSYGVHEAPRHPRFISDFNPTDTHSA